MRKVYEIFSSSSVDPSVKKSAVDQLAIILQDHNLHAPFKAEGGVETVLKHLKLGLVRNDDAQVKNSVCFLISCQKNRKNRCSLMYSSAWQPHALFYQCSKWLFVYIKIENLNFCYRSYVKKNWENRTWNTEPETVQAGHMIQIFCHLNSSTLHICIIIF